MNTIHKLQEPNHQVQLPIFKRAVFMKKDMLNEPTQLKINETLEKQFKVFFNELEQKQCFDTVEFRLQYQKKMYKFIEYQCPIMAKDLDKMKENYLKRNRV